MRDGRTISLAAWLLLALLLSACGGGSALRKIGASRSGVGYDVQVQGGYAYLTDNDGLTVLDLQNPTRPRKVGRLRTGTSFGVTVVEGLAYVVGDCELAIADVGDPADPQRLAVYRGKGCARQVRVAEPYAYLTSSWGLEVVDVSDPGAPIQVGALGDGVEREGLAVADGLVYLADPARGLEVIDVTDPAHPVEVGTVPGSKGAWDVHLDGARIYLGCYGAGIRVLDRTDPRAPRVIGSFRDEDGGEAQGVWGDGRFLYVADNYGVEVLDIADPARPHQIAEYGRAGAAHDLDVEGRTVYVAEGRRGLLVLQFEPDSSLAQ